MPALVTNPSATQTVSTDGYEDIVAVALSGTSATAVYTAAAASLRRITKVKKLVISNDTAGAINITVTLTRSAVVYTYYPVTSLAARGRLEFPSSGEDMEMSLRPADILKVTGDTGVYVFVSVREYQGNKG